MARSNVTNCSECAYSRKDENPIWCPFHDLPVSNKLVCDDFLNEFESPQWHSLLKTESLNESVKNFTGRDIIALIITGLIFLVCIFLMVI